MSVSKKYRIITSILLVIYSIVSVTIPYLTSTLVDYAISFNTTGWTPIIVVSSIIIGVVLFEILITLLKNYLSYRFSLNLEKELKRKLYVNILSKDIKALGDYHAASLEQLFNSDITNVINKELEVIPGIARDISKVLVACGLVAYLDWRFLLGLFVVGVFGFFGAKVYSRIVRSHHKMVLESEAKTSSFIVESISNIKLLKSYEANEFAINHFDSLTDEMISKKKKRNTLFFLAQGGLFAFGNIVFAIALIYGGCAIAWGFITYGTLVALLQLVNAIEVPVFGFSSLINALSLSNASIERLDNCLKLEEEKNKEEIKSFDSIIFNHVSFKYDSKPIIDDLSFEINNGDKVLVTGPSGIGKTTLFMLLLGFITPDSGTINIKTGGNIVPLSSATRSLFGYVPQENILFSGSIKDNIYILTGIKDDSVINEALSKANILDEINNLPNKLDTILGERGSGLSIGQLQRLLIAIAILKNNTIMLLDEFSSALDAKNEELIMNNLSNMNNTIIYITHRKASFENDKVIKLG